jgi:hypothetical protein
VQHPICALLLLAFASAAAGCGEPAPTREAAIESFQTANPAASEEQAACVVDGLIARYGLEELAEELEAEPIAPELEEVQFSTMFLCGMEGDVREQISTQLEDAGIASDDAPCVSDELVGSMSEEDVGVLLSGEITDSFAEKFYDAVESCDALSPS